jgi:hypothetical protein
MPQVRSSLLMLTIALAPLMAHAQAKNEMVGAWKMVSAIADPGGRNIAMFGPRGSGLLIFSSDLHYIAVINNPEMPKFASNNRMTGTLEENKAAVQGSIAVYGRYSVDQNGHINEGHIDGSTFPNWNDMEENGRVVLVEGDKITEMFKTPSGLPAVIVWQRTN